MNELPQALAGSIPSEMELGILPSASNRTSKDGGRPTSLDLTELNFTTPSPRLSRPSSPGPSAPPSTRGYSRSPSPSVRVVDALPPTDGGRQAWTFLAAAFAAEALV